MERKRKGVMYCSWSECAVARECLVGGGEAVGTMRTEANLAPLKPNSAVLAISNTLAARIITGKGNIRTAWQCCQSGTRFECGTF